MADTTAKRQKSRIVKEDAGGIANTLTNIVKQRLAADTASAEPGQDGALRGRRQPQAAEKENSGPIPAPKGKKAKLDQEPQRPATSGNVAGERTVEQIYQKKTQLEHILLRPDSYVGSTERQSAEHWIMDDSTNKMVKKTLQYVPALYKIFDEILVNAADNLVRDPENMDYIKVDIDAEAGVISVTNNGKGLPVVMHKEHKCYVPELVFGHLLTSDNYNDNDAKTVGGRNGYGAKLANVFSLEFTIETCDGSKKYIQNFEKNMSVKHPPKITDLRGKPAQYTKVTFKPDVAKFGMTKLDADIVSLFAKRVYDCAGSTLEKCHVHLNGEKLDVRNFKDYTDLYLLSRQGVPQIFEVCSPRWEVCVSLTEAGFQQVSFVNSICTIRGGTHVNHVTDQVVEAIIEKVKIAAKEKVKGGVDVKPHHVKNHLWVFVKCLIENPAFDSQTKETLMTKQSKFGSRCELSDKFLSEVSNSGVVDLILTWALAKTKVDLGKKLKTNTGKVSRLMGVPKLEDANDAGGKNSADCTLILTEGDSAKALAVAGLSVVGRDKFGVFPLRGKVLNVRDATFKQMMANEEIQNLMKIVGLDMNKEYEADENGQVNGLRYGSIMIMTDQDADGSHIKGLLINLIHSWWPSLARIPGFLKEFFTPIVKATKGRSQQISFYTIPEYEKWKQDHENGKGYKLKYYKGLGTSTSQEGREYFADLENHEIEFRYTGPEEDDLIDMAFNSKRADDRKEWISAVEEGTFVNHSEETLSYTDFVKKELVLFAKYDVERMIPSLVDGFKPGQRKVLFGAFKKKLNSDCKVAQFAGYVAEHSAYHHGESSLQGTIVNMAQTFVGSNNINLLIPSGQFGTRLQGGKDHAACRYIFTRLSKAARCVFPEDDDPILSYQNEEGMGIEPEWYCPVIPMVLVNGADGIGVGWSTNVPNYNPRDIIANIRRLFNREPMEPMQPWYRGFQGSIQPIEGEHSKYAVTGIARKVGRTRLDITELPIRKWTQDYKEWLSHATGGGGGDDDDEKKAKKGALHLDDFKEYHTDNTVHFTVHADKSHWNAIEKDDLLKALKLRTSVSTSNMVFFDYEGKIKKYATELEVLEDFAKLRLKYYQKRKDYNLGRLRRDKELIDAKVKFILMVIKGELVVSKRKREDLVAELKKHGFKTLEQINSVGKAEAVAEEAAPTTAAKAGASSDKALESKTGYNYLLGMPLWSLTYERVEQLKKEMKDKTAELTTLQGTSIEDLWEKDLQAVMEELDIMDEEAEELRKEEERLKNGGAKRARARPKARRRKKKDDEEEEEDEEEEDEEDEEPAPKRPVTSGPPKDEKVEDMLERLKAKQKLRSQMAKADDEEPAAKRAKAA
eukprot:gnl/TRDRNA2_/TRDRNA2_174938_c5_seq6.p1 gnl/TRDRNA2_/TRDRNA2_174938_c5~~gnl/TRDRNA2_/TRDRNA2_174938_c5_seq6.p1  ORF type:complete len:1372 (-),score=438.03 gnl/TRDRNA2_/TRDRNA2_174938_c5_seq6:62-4120(-)